VNDIYQDDLGYLWFATQDGLNRYDGYNFIIYRPDKADPWSISDNFITRIIPAEDGNLWVLVRYGLNLFDRSSGRFYKVYSGSTGALSVPSDVFQWNGKWMSIISHRLYALPDRLSKPSDTLITPVNLPDTVLFAATINADLTLVTQGKLVRLNQNAEIVEEMKLPSRANSYDRFIEEMGESFLFISNKLYQFNSDLFRLTPIVQLDEVSIIQDICVRKDSSIWIGHSTGLAIFKDDNLHQVETLSNGDGSLSYPFVHSVFEDADKNMWVGTANGGLNIVPKGAERFMRISKEHGLSHNQVWCAYEDTEQNLWIGTEMGLNVFNDFK
jgi:ligand-binding sensor domain-containing protein